jgi:hypothetical protein
LRGLRRWLEAGLPEPPNNNRPHHSFQGGTYGD